MKNILLVGLLAFIGMSASAQRSTTAKEADYSFLKGKNNINVIFTYDGMTVGKNQTEDDYVSAKVAEKNEKKAGAGDEWKKSWEKGKLSIYEPAFMAGFTKKLGKLGIKVSEGDDADITLIVKTTRIEPGFNAGVVKKAAQIDLEYLFVETADQSKIISQIVMSRVGGADTYAVSDRVRVAYLAASKRLSKFIKKGLK